MAYSYEKNPEEIIEKLLEYHDANTLRKIIRQKSRRVTRAHRNFLYAASLVLLNLKGGDVTQAWAINEVADYLKLSSNTVRNHLAKLRATIKKELRKAYGDPLDEESERQAVKTVLDDFADELRNEKGFSPTEFTQIFYDVVGFYKRGAYTGSKWDLSYLYREPF